MTHAVGGVSGESRYRDEILSSDGSQLRVALLVVRGL